LLDTSISCPPEEQTSDTHGNLRSIGHSDSGLMTAFAVELDKEIQGL
jgi:hypothetical protein